MKVICKIVSILFFCGTLISKEAFREEVTFYSKKDPSSNEMIPRKGLLIKKENAPATILIMHGFGGDKTEVGPLRLLLNKYNVMSFDFRAHGENKCDQLSTIGHDEVYDVFGAVDYIKSDPDLKKLPVIAFGLSMGAATAIEAQAIDPNLFNAMFLDTPFSTSECFIQKITDSLSFKIFGYECDFIKRIVRQYAFTPLGQALIRLFIKLKGGDLKVQTHVKPISPLNSIKKVYVPVCFIVCKHDEKIPYEEVVKIVEEHPGATRLVITGGRQHCDSVFHMPEQYKQVLNGFIQDVISGEINQQSKKEVMKFFLEDDNKMEKKVEKEFKTLGVEE